MSFFDASVLSAILFALSSLLLLSHVLVFINDLVWLSANFLSFFAPAKLFGVHGLVETGPLQGAFVQFCVMVVFVAFFHWLRGNRS